MDEVQQPIVVNESPVSDQIWAGIRQIAPAVMAFAVGRQWVAGDTATVLGVIVGVIWPIVVGQLKTRKRALQLAVVAKSPEVPARIARLKSNAPVEDAAELARRYKGEGL